MRRKSLAAGLVALVAMAGWAQKGPERPKIGLDGKYQFNLYDPDGIRLERMNFYATNAPCCSPFTAVARRSRGRAIDEATLAARINPCPFKTLFPAF